MSGGKAAEDSLPRDLVKVLRTEMWLEHIPVIFSIKKFLEPGRMLPSYHCTEKVT